MASNGRAQRATREGKVHWATKRLENAPFEQKAAKAARGKGIRGMEAAAEKALGRKISGAASVRALGAVARMGVASVLPAAADAAMRLVARGVDDRIAAEAKLQQSLMKQTRRLQAKRKAK